MKTDTHLNNVQSYIKYIIVSIAFAVWIVFFDNNNLLIQQKLLTDIQNLEELHRTFAVQQAEYSAKLEELIKSPEILAREKFHMHKSNEIVFILE